MSLEGSAVPNSSMRTAITGKIVRWTPLAACLVACVLGLLWLRGGSELQLTQRTPGSDHAPDSQAGGVKNPVLLGTLINGSGQPSDSPGSWPGFLGPHRTGSAESGASLSRTWQPGGPRVLWSLEVGEGYAGPAIANGRVFLMDYDQDKKQDAVRCLSLGDGKEIWRFAYPVSVKRNHGMSRTVPAITGNYLVTLGPKCHIACLDASSGQLKWGLDLVEQFGATVPPWYAGQCPLIDADRVILVPGGKDALLLAVNVSDGQVVWKTPNPKGWKMTHSSIVPMSYGGERMYVYCASGGVVGVSATDGRMLWETSAWKISIATVPSPTILEDGRIFLSGGYNAGSLMLQLKKEAAQFTAEQIFRLDPETYGATQHTPIFYNGKIFGVRPDGEFVCLSPDGQVIWSSGSAHVFNLGSFLLADGLIFALNDSGTLSLIDATAPAFSLLGQAQVLRGRESWAPMALAGTRLIVRDLTQMVCLDVGVQADSH